MSAVSSPLAPSPQPDAARASRVCLECKRKKKKCDKALPKCGRCAEAQTSCTHEEDLLDGAYTPVIPHFPATVSAGGSSAIPRRLPQGWGNASLIGSIRSVADIHQLAFQTMRDILVDFRAVEQVVSSYFAAAHTWITILDRTRLEKQLESLWQNPSAETCVLVLCMSLLTRPSSGIPNFPMGDSIYQSAKALLTLVHSSGQVLSTTSIQAELLVAMFECSNGLPQQAYFSVGRCVQMSRAFGWHRELFWEQEKRQRLASEMKLASTLWWAIVNVDELISLAYPEQGYPMHTADLNLGFEIPLPKDFNEYLTAAILGQSFADRPMFDIDGMALPEATSAWCLSNAMQQLYNPTTPEQVDRLSGAIINHTASLDGVPGSGPWVNGDHSGAMATGLIPDEIKCSWSPYWDGAVGSGYYQLS